MNNNRDFKRQNKSHTVVNGTVYNMLTQDCIKGIQSLSNTELDTPSTAVVQQRYDHLQYRDCKICY